MKQAVSMWLGGKLIDAENGDYSTYKDLGMVCPFCHQAVFWRKSHNTQTGTQVTASWCHFSLSKNPEFCEVRSVSSEGREIIEKLKPEARNQRLEIFNNYFWQIYIQDKYIAPEVRDTIKSQRLIPLVKHCQKLWDVELIKAGIRDRILTFNNKNRLDTSLKTLEIDLTEQQKQILFDELNVVAANMTPLKYKILNEVIEWLKTPSSFRVFHKMLCLAVYELAEVVTAPIHSNDVANCIVDSLLFVDWENSLEIWGNRLKPKSGKGFGKR